jgi:hypothetical protein
MIPRSLFSKYIEISSEEFNPFGDRYSDFLAVTYFMFMSFYWENTVLSLSELFRIVLKRIGSLGFSGIAKEFQKYEEIIQTRR